MSILVVAPRYTPDAGGIETLLAQVLPELAARGHEIVVAAGTDRDDQATFEVIDGIPVYRVPFGIAVLSAQPGEILAVSRHLREVEAEHDVTVRHVQGFGDIGLWYAMRAHRRAPLPLAVSVHGTFEWLGYLGPSALALLQSADVVTAVSEPVRAAIDEAAPGLAGQVRLIRNGLHVEVAEPAPWPAHGPLLCVGRLLDQKGFDVAIEALARLRTTHPALELVIAGGGPDYEAIRRQAARAGVRARVHLLGCISRDEVQRAMHEAAIVLVPSRSTEGFSLVALEAAHAARPVIASSVGGLVETVEHDVTGMLVPPDDPGALASAIARLLGEPGRAAVMGEIARERAKTRFPFEPCVDAYELLYEELESKAPLAASRT